MISAGSLPSAIDAAAHEPRKLESYWNVLLITAAVRNTRPVSEAEPTSAVQ